MRERIFVILIGVLAAAVIGINITLESADAAPKREAPKTVVKVVTDWSTKHDGVRQGTRVITVNGLTCVETRYVAYYKASGGISCNWAGDAMTEVPR